MWIKWLVLNCIVWATQRLYYEVIGITHSSWSNPKKIGFRFVCTDESERLKWVCNSVPTTSNLKFLNWEAKWTNLNPLYFRKSIIKDVKNKNSDTQWEKLSVTEIRHPTKISIEISRDFLFLNLTSKLDETSFKWREYNTE